MVSTDTVIGVVGAVVLAGAMVAVFYYESQNPTLDSANAVGEGALTFDVAWNMTEMPGQANGPELNAQTSPSQEHELTVPSFTTNVTLTLVWTDNDARPQQLRSGPDTFRIVVTDQDGNEICRQEGANPAGGEGRLTCAYTNSSVEQPTTPRRVRGNDTADAQRQLDEAVGGAMTWTVTVTLVSTGEQAPNQLPSQLPTDRTNAYRLDWTINHWMAELSPP